MISTDISTDRDSPPVRFANLQVMIAAAARQLVAGSKWITKEATNSAKQRRLIFEVDDATFF